MKEKSGDEGADKSTTRETTGEIKEVLTFCRICEPSCGLVAQVQNGRIISVQGNRDHVSSQGHFCKKAVGAVEVTYDPDRVLRPLKRVGAPGEFEPISWRQAMTEIAGRLAQIRKDHGPAAFATFLGQPPTNSYSTAMWYPAFKKVLGTKWNYAVNAEDSAAYMRACEILYGSVSILPKPDLWRTDFAIIIGANPLVSHGSLCGEPQIRKCLKDIVGRGGRVVVIDPRRTETAQLFEHIGINAGTDAWLLLAMLREILVDGLIDHEFVAARTRHIEELRAIVEPFSPEMASSHCGVGADVIRALARDLAAAPSALIYGRTGTCTQQFGTLINLLQNLICLVTGNVDRAGGMVIPVSPFGGNPTISSGPRAETLRSRTTGLPAVAGYMPSRALVSDITEPGPERVRALMMLGANPLSSSAATGPAYVEALAQLDLFFSLDLYVTETNRHAHYILPVTTIYEHEDVPFKYLFAQLRPAIWATQAVIKPCGEARDDWQIMNDICRRLGEGGAYESKLHRIMAAAGWEVKPATLLDKMIRRSEMGRKHGLSLRRLLEQDRNGVSLEEGLPVGLWSERSHPIDLAGPELAGEMLRLAQYETDTTYPYRLIGMREMLSQNTWMHNVPVLMPPGRRHQLHVSPVDAAKLQVNNGDQVEVTSAAGKLKTPVYISDRMTPGNVALPHGWGHAGGGRRANAAGGVNSNVLAGKGPRDVEALAGMSILNGIPVRIHPVSEDMDAGQT